MAPLGQRATPPIPQQTSNLINIEEPGIRVDPIDVLKKWTVSASTGTNPIISSENEPDVIKFSNIPLWGTYANTMGIFQGDDQALADILSELEFDSATADTLLGKTFIT